MTAVASGRISHYGGGGRTQLIAVSLRQAGEGDLELNKRRLLARLMEEGLTDPSRKRELPRFPARIAVLTSPEGAAIEDIRRTLGRRWPVAEVVLLPIAVQGDSATASIVGAFGRLRRMDSIDTAILARGGGSAADLWAFNDEAVARAVADCAVPVVTGIGHEIDTSVCDYVSDLSAATPTAAAEMATPDAAEVGKEVGNLVRRIGELCSRDARQRLERVEFIMRSSAFPAIEHALERSRLSLDDRLDRLSGWRSGLPGAGEAAVEGLTDRLRLQMADSMMASSGTLSRLTERLAGITPAGGVEARLERLGKLLNSARLLTEGRLSSSRANLLGKTRTLRSLGPGEVLGRGFTYCTGEEDGRIIGRVEELGKGENISVNFLDGTAGCLVKSRRKDSRWRQRSHSRTR
jgi:exodeoxyribonuclease VII large subunit